MNKKIIGSIIAIILLISFIGYFAYKDPQTRFSVAKILGLKKSPQVGSNINIEEYMTGLRNPTTMSFVENDIMFLEKNTGMIKIIKNGKVLDEPLHDFNVSNMYESGLLGILVDNQDVYVYVTEANGDGGDPIADNIYKFSWDGEKLENKQLIKSLPGFASWHNGGILVKGLDGTIFGVRGDQREPFGKLDYGILQNQPKGQPDDTGIILIVNRGEDITPSKSSDPSEYYYAIGIRNSFGLAIDPITGNLWDTENGDESFDEINFVPHMMNSGWNKIMGPVNATQIIDLPHFHNFSYSDPEFSWKNTVAPTAIVFSDERLSVKFQDTVFVADCSGTIYNFKLNSDRTGFVFNNPQLSDNIADPDDDLSEIIVAKGMGCISDMKISPYGSIFVISHASNAVMYKITFS